MLLSISEPRPVIAALYLYERYRIVNIISRIKFARRNKKNITLSVWRRFVYFPFCFLVKTFSNDGNYRKIISNVNRYWTQRSITTKQFEIRLYFFLTVFITEETKTAKTKTVNTKQSNTEFRIVSRNTICPRWTYARVITQTPPLLTFVLLTIRAGLELCVRSNVRV